MVAASFPWGAHVVKHCPSWPLNGLLAVQCTIRTILRIRVVQSIAGGLKHSSTIGNVELIAGHTLSTIPQGLQLAAVHRMCSVSKSDARTMTCVASVAVLLPVRTKDSSKTLHVLDSYCTILCLALYADVLMYSELACQVACLSRHFYATVSSELLVIRALLGRHTLFRANLPSSTTLVLQHMQPGLSEVLCLHALCGNTRYYVEIGVGMCLSRQWNVHALCIHCWLVMLIVSSMPNSSSSPQRMHDW